MKKKFVNASYRFITKYEKCDELKEKKIKYGLESLYNLLTKVIVMLGLSILFNIWKEYLLLVGFYSLVRRYTYGIHAKSTLACWFTTIPIYMLGCYFIKFASLPNPIIYFIWSLSFVSFLLWAPADTPARPLIHQNIRKQQKTKSCLICILYLLLIIALHIRYIDNVIIYSLLIQSICINPITYWITKTPFDNYKVYYKKHGLNF